MGELAARSPGGLSVAASAYALKHDGSLGYADTTAGEAEGGAQMEAAGLPALRSFGANLTILGMCYFTHGDGIAAVLAEPQPFIAAVVAKVREQGLAGMDLDYEPQGVAAAYAAARRRGASPVSFPAFLAMLAQALDAAGGYALTIDAEGGAPGSCASIPCAAYAAIGALRSVNTMDTFNINTVAAFQGMMAVDLPVLGDKWAPGFEPANLGDALGGIVAAALAGNVSQMASWAIHEWNNGPQPQAFIDGVAAFLAG